MPVILQVPRRLSSDAVVATASGSALQVTARDDFAAFLSLHTLSPVAMTATTGSEAAVATVLAGAWGSTYDAWNADRNLTPVQREQGLATYSTQYLDDRAAMLDSLVARNQLNSEVVSANPGTTGRHFRDVTTGIEFDSGLSNPSIVKRQTLFGGVGDDLLNGRSLADHLYGGAGADTLSGQGGADWLEGQSGDDRLDGGAGSDTLLGGTGNDVLNGGADNDRLLGGQGLDVYGFSAGWGADAIVDSDGSGGIFVDGLAQIDGAGAIKIAEGTWQTPDRRINYSLVPMDGGRSDLFISFSDRNDVIRIEDWSDQRRLGITLPGSIAPPPANGSLLAGDIIKQFEGTTYATIPDGGYVSAGVHADAPDVLIGGQTNDSLSGLGGNDGLSGGEGHDLLEGGAGHDLLIGGLGADTLNGGTGNDLIYGSGVGGIDRPTRTDFTPPTTTGVEVARGFSWVAARADAPRWQGDTATMRYVGVTGAYVNPQFTSGGQVYVEAHSNVIDGGAGDDYIVAGSGMDVVHGGDDNDDIIGMRDDDLLFGDAGDDFIWGDGQGAVGTAEYTPPDQQGDDILIGGAGDDVLVGQGGRDQLYGGADDDMLWGDYTDVEDTPLDTHGEDFLDGGAGDDRLAGGGLNDTVIGGIGNDRLWGDGSAGEGLTLEVQGRDDLEGGADHDQIHGGGSDDRLDGGTGNDSLWGDDDIDEQIEVSSHGRDTLDGDAGDDYLEGGANSDTLMGGTDNDTLFGDGRLYASDRYGVDFLDGGSGNDYLDGGGGADALMGGDGHDYLYGDGGAVDIHSIDHGADHLDGGAGNDWLFGYGGDDVLVGSDGNDWLAGEDYDGRLLSSALTGNDRLSGGAGADTLHGGNGVDTLDGGAGDDLLVGGEGADVYAFSAGWGHDVLVDAGPSQGVADVVVFAEGVAVSDVTLSALADFGLQIRFSGGDEVVVQRQFAPSDSSNPYGQSIETIVFADGTVWDYSTITRMVLASTDGDDSLVGYWTNDTVSGGDGNDTLLGNAGADLLEGGTGSDSLDGGVGDDTLVGGTGSDTMFAGDGDDHLQGNGAYDQLYGGAGNDTLDGGHSRGPGYFSDLLGAYMDGGDGDDVYLFGRGSGNQSARDNGLLGSSFDTVLLGAGVVPSDVTLTRVSDYGLLIQINGTDDQLLVDNHFYPLYPTSTLERRIESIAFSDGARWDLAAINSRVLNSTSGDDLLVGYADIDDLSGGGGNDTLDGGEGADTLAGGDGADWLSGDLHADLLDGGNGNDSLFGGDGSDVLAGGAGADTLSGGAGNDTLDGGAGDDFIEGSEGIDTFRFALDSGNDTVYALEADAANQDRIEFLAGVDPGDVTVTQSGGDLILGINGSSGQLVVQHYFSSSYTAPRIVFNNGTNWDYATTSSLISVTVPAGVAINGGSGGESLQGGDGADYVYGNGGNDTLDAGAGNDHLAGGAGNDVYLFGPGWGHDTVYQQDASTNTVDEVRMGVGIAASDVLLTRDAYDLLIRVLGTADSLRLKDHYYPSPSPNRIDRIAFADGRVWDSAMIELMVGAGDGGQTLIGGSNDDALLGGGDGDRALGGAGDDMLQGGGGKDGLFGEAGDDSLTGQDGDDTLLGGLDNDLLDGGAGRDLLDGGLGNDTYVFALGSGKDTISSFDATAGRVDVVRLGVGITADNLVATNSDWIERSLLLSVRGTSDSLQIDGFFSEDGAGGRQVDQVIFADGTVWGVADIKLRVLTASDDNDRLVGYATDDSIEGLLGDDLIFGLAGDDTLDGSHGEDELRGGDGADVILGGNQHDDLDGDEGNDTLHGQDGNDTLSGGSGDDLLYGGAGNDELSGGGSAHGGTNNDTLDGGAGDDELLGSDGYATFLFGRGDGQDRLFGSVSSEQRNVLQFKAGVSPSDIRVARVAENAYYNWLELSIVGSGDRVRVGSFFNSSGSLGQQTSLQTVRFSDGTTWDAPMLAAMATLAPITGTALADSLSGTAASEILAGLGGNDSLDGGGGDDWIDGGTGADAMTGGVGGDTYVVDNTSDTVVENAGEGNDTTVSSVDWVLGDNVETLRLVGAAAIAGSGNAMSNALAGNSASNVLNGGEGADTMSGGAGDDVYVVDDSGDVVTEGVGGGVDTVRSSLTWTLGADLENLTLLGTLAVSGTGNAGANVLQGNSANNVLTGGAGADTMLGGAGDDLYRVDVAGDLVIESVNEGIDTVETVLTWGLAENIERLVLTGTGAINGTGNALDNALTGNNAANRLDGGAGIDTIAGGAGNDTYVVDDHGDLVIELTAGGTDTVEASVSYLLPAEVERLTLTGAGAINGTGNALANALIGNAAANRINGGTGIDSMTGNGGDDTYVVDSTGDSIIEAINGGNDTVESTISWTLAVNLENLVLVGSGTINATGNSATNVLTGNSAANVLVGAAGADTMSGGDGDDVYGVDNVLDVVVEMAARGADRIESSVSYTLSAWTENLTLTGTGNINATGNELNNALLGNAGANRLDGGVGADTMIGGAGNDVYVVDTTADGISEATSGGTDTIEASLSWVLGAELENLTLTGANTINGTGNAAANTLRGNSGNNVLVGLAGSDTMIGEAGDDTYVVDVTTDVVTESASQGDDLVQSTVTWTLGSNVERLTLTGNSAINGTGNALSNALVGNGANNTLTGGDGHDTIDGGLGTDSMVGGNGDDSYFVNASTDVVTEATGAGVDLVNSAVTWTLGSNLENLTLSGSSAINGTGNALNNVLTGNSAANALAGAAGNDTYVGGQGNDSLTDSSTTSADVYRWGTGQGNDSINDAGGSDRIEILPGVTSSQVTLTRSGNNLQVGIAGASDVLTVLNWYTSSANRIEEIRLSDGSVIGAGAAPQSVTTGSASTLGARAMADSETMPATPWRGPATATAWLIASKSDLLLDAMAQFDPPVGVVLAGDADRLATTMPALAANAM